MKKKMISVLLCAALLSTLLIGCGGKTATENEAEKAAAEEGGTAAQENSQDTTDQQVQVSFNPDEETDTIPYSELEKEFGPLSEAEVPSDIKIGCILKNLANEFWLQLGEGMKTEAGEFGAEIELQASRTETDVVGQLGIAETMIENNYDALVLSPLTNDNLNSAVATAKKAGIPIVNANCEYIADCDSFVGGLQIEIGQKAADYIAEKIGEKGKVAIIEGVAGTFTSIQRVNGFNENIKKYPGIEVVASVPADYEVEKGMNVATDIITQNPDIDAIYCCNDNMALGAVEALRLQNLLGKVIVLGVDGTGDAYKSIKKGELTATVDQFADGSGQAAVEVALRLLAGQDIPKVVSTPIEVIDAENEAEFGK